MSTHPFKVLSATERALLDAVSIGDTDGARAAIEQGARADTCDVLGNSVLHVACGHGHVVCLLLEAGADPTVVDRDGDTPLHRAAAEGDWHSVKALLDAGADPLAKRQRRPNDKDRTSDHLLSHTPFGIVLAGGDMEMTLQSLGRDSEVLANLHRRIERRAACLDAWLTARPDAYGIDGKDLYQAMTDNWHTGHRESCGGKAIAPILGRHGFNPKPWTFLLERTMSSLPLLNALLDNGLDVQGTVAMETLARSSNPPPRIQSIAETLQAHGARWSEAALAQLESAWEGRGLQDGKDVLAWARAQAAAQGLGDVLPAGHGLARRRRV